jgi:predicted DNA-binding transcriptional regulator YafY
MPLTTVGFFTAREDVNFLYTNYKLETERRRVKPIKVWYGSTQYHTGPQWFLHALDLDKDEERNFAMRDMSEVSY